MFKLGQKVSDKISGITGIITGRLDFLNGSLQFHIQPPAKDNKEADGYWTDAINLVAIEGGIDVPLPRSPLFELGEELKDRVTGFTGIALRRHINIRGRHEYGLQTKAKKGAEPIKTQYFDDTQLVSIGKGFRALAKEVKVGAGGARNSRDLP